MQSGSCKIIFGPMFSGKTHELCRELTVCADVGLKVLYINHIEDIRKTEKTTSYLTTHHSSFGELSYKIDKIKIKSLKDIHNFAQYKVIGIDEGQFFDDLDIIVRKWVLDYNITVIIASLDGDYEMKPFGKAKELICICEPGNVTKLAAKCMKCIHNDNKYKLTDAGFTHRISGGTDQCIVGGTDKYMSVCKSCHRI